MYAGAKLQEISLLFLGIWYQQIGETMSGNPFTMLHAIKAEKARKLALQDKRQKIWNHAVTIVICAVVLLILSLVAFQTPLAVNGIAIAAIVISLIGISIWAKPASRKRVVLMWLASVIVAGGITVTVLLLTH